MLLAILGWCKAAVSQGRLLPDQLNIVRMLAPDPSCPSLQTPLRMTSVVLFLALAEDFGES